MFLDLSFNKIRLINKNHFTCLPNLTQINLTHNEVANIVELIFSTLSKLRTLLLNNNEITSLFRCAFYGLEELTMLNLMNNNIVFVDSSIFCDTNIHVIITDDFFICCMYFKSRSICTVKPIWPTSCNALISTMNLKLAAWFVGLLVVMLNLLLISSNFISGYKGKLRTYEKCVIGVNVSDFMVKINLLSLAVTDTAIGNNYVN